MKTSAAIVLAVACLGLFASVPACGSDGDSTFVDNGKNQGVDGGTSGGTSGIGASGGTSSSGGPEPVDDGGACAAKNADAARKPAYLFFILDQSFSMAATSPCIPGGSGSCTGATPAACCTAEKAKRWTPITTALDTFIHDPASVGITAGLELFPAKSNGCSAAGYATTEANMDVKMTPLNPQIGTAFSSKWPVSPTILSTPTKAVFQAIGPIAKKWATDHTDGKTAIVLLTDGVPQGCTTDDDKIDNVAIEVAKYSDTVPVYVIGVSDDPTNLADLQKLADAGKTTLTLVDTADPAKTQKAFLDRIDEIRKTTLSCDVSLPAAPDGQTLDLNKVNVSFTSSKGTKDALTYDEQCTGTGKSWHFDSTTAPTKISLCAASCDAYKADPAGTVGVEFGCQRRDDVVK